MSRTIPALATSLVLYLAASAQAQDLYDFDGLADPALLTTRGAAHIGIDGLVLTPDEHYQAGSAFWHCPIEISEESSLTVYLAFKIDGEQQTKGADGLALVLQASATGVGALGRAGGELAFGGVAPGVGVEFDTYKNAQDPSDNHVALVTSQSPGVHLASGDSPLDFNSGEVRHVWIDYDALARTIEVRVAATQSRPSAPVMAGSMALESLIGHTAYIGLVAATGAYRNRHVILAWQVLAQAQPDTDGDQRPNGCDTDDDNDGVRDEVDNCPTTANPEQSDDDGDDIGDACDESPNDGADSDSDQDGLDNADEADFGTDPFVADSDHDAILDGDELPENVAADLDGDGFVNALDSDSDGDGVLDLAEAGDELLQTPPVDSDGDGAADFLDTDSDNDGVPDQRDRCRTVADPAQTDTDGNGIGDACEGLEGAGEEAVAQPGGSGSGREQQEQEPRGGGSERRIDPSERPPPPGGVRAGGGAGAQHATAAPVAARPGAERGATSDGDPSGREGAPMEVGDRPAAPEGHGASAGAGRRGAQPHAGRGGRANHTPERESGGAGPPAGGDDDAPTGGSDGAAWMLWGLAGAAGLLLLLLMLLLRAR